MLDDISHLGSDCAEVKMRLVVKSTSYFYIAMFIVQFSVISFYITLHPARSGENYSDKVRAQVENEVGSQGILFIKNRNISPPFSKSNEFAYRFWKAIGDENVIFQHGPKFMYYSAYLVNANLAGGIVSYTNRGYAQLAIGTIDEILVLNINQSDGECDWSVKYRMWLKDLTPVGEVLLQQLGRDSVTFQDCFRIERSGLELVYRFLDEF